MLDRKRFIDIRYSLSGADKNYAKRSLYIRHLESSIIVEQKYKTTHALYLHARHVDWYTHRVLLFLNLKSILYDVDITCTRSFLYEFMIS